MVFFASPAVFCVGFPPRCLPPLSLPSPLRVILPQGSISLWTNVPLLPTDKFNRTTFRCAAGSDDNSDAVWQVRAPLRAHYTTPKSLL